MKKIIIILIGILIAAGCSKDDNNTTSGIDCNRFADSFISNDYQYTKLVIDSICRTMPPQPTSDDQLGHKLNSEKLTEQISNECENIKIKMSCYACFESYPPQSSFTVTVDSMGVSVKRRFLVFVPKNDFMYMN